MPIQHQIWRNMCHPLAGRASTMGSTRIRLLGSALRKEKSKAQIQWSTRWNQHTVDQKVWICKEPSMCQQTLKTWDGHWKSGKQQPKLLLVSAGASILASQTIWGPCKMLQFSAHQATMLLTVIVMVTSTTQATIFTPLRVGWPPTPQVYFGPWEGLRVVFPRGGSSS